MSGGANLEMEKDKLGKRSSVNKLQKSSNVLMVGGCHNLVKANKLKRHPLVLVSVIYYL